MNPKNTWLLAAVTLGLFAFIFFFERHLRPPAPGPARAMPGLHAAEVSAIQVDLPGQPEIRAERTNGGWQLTKPLLYPAQTEAVEALLRAAAELSPQTHLSAQTLAGGPSVSQEYGFDNPQATLVFQQGGAQRQLVLGALTAPGDQVYAEVVGMEGVDILDADFFRKYVPRQANDWRDTAFTSLKAGDFDRLTVAGGQQSFELERDGANGVWQMNKPVQTRADYPKINGLLQKLEGLRVARFVTDDPRADLEAYGLQPPALELKFDLGTNHAESLQFGGSPTNAPDLVYARRNGRNCVVLAPREAIAPWQGGYQEFRDRRLVRLAPGLPEAIEVFGPEHFTVQRRENGAWRVTQPEDFPADTNAMREFIQTLATMEAVRANNDVAVTDAALPDADFPKYGLSAPARRYVLREGTNTHTGAGAAGVSNLVFAELDFGAAKDGKIYARRADRPAETSIYAVNPADFQKLPATAMQLRERRIWNFAVDDVLSVTIRQNGRTEKSSRVGQARWVGAPIEELKMEVGADELGSLEAEEWVQRGDADRARFGFTDQSLEISTEVRADGKPRVFTVVFGGKSPRGLRYGDVRMPDGQNWIFEAPAVTLDRLLTFFSLQENAGP